MMTKWMLKPKVLVLRSQNDDGVIIIVAGNRMNYLLADWLIKASCVKDQMEYGMFRDINRIGTICRNYVYSEFHNIIFIYIHASLFMSQICIR
jgi:hypothetical protein